MNRIDVYDTYTMHYRCSFERNNENILHFVASLALTDAVSLVDIASDELVLTTIGNFLDVVPDQTWLNEILPQLIALQTGEKNFMK